MHSSLRAAALRYAAQGWPVFLLSAKRPLANCRRCPKEGQPGAHDPQGCTCLTCHGFYAATTDPDRVEAMFRVPVRCPMLAVRTGAASKLVVVDADAGKGGLQSLQQLVAEGLCPPTAWARTGGGGIHLFYRHPGQHLPCSQGKLAAGIDIKADGGYAVLAPSLHPVSRVPYQWARQGPVQEVPPPLQQRIKAVAAITAAAAPARPRLRSIAEFPFPDRLLDTLIRRLRDAPEGARRVTLYGCARGVARMVAAGAIEQHGAVAALLHTATTDAKQSERDARNAIAGGFRAEGVRL